MNKFKNYVWMAAGFAILAAVVSGIAAGPAVAELVKAALVKNVDEPGRAPYHVIADCTPAANGCSISFPAVPANKRLVLQFLSVDVKSSNAITDNPVVFLADASGANGHVFLVPERSNNFTWASAQPLTAYIEPGVVPKLNVSQFGSTNLQASGILTGSCSI